MKPRSYISVFCRASSSSSASFLLRSPSKEQLGARVGSGWCEAFVRAVGDAENAGLLDHVSDVRADGGGRPDGDGAARTHREGLQGCGYSGFAGRNHAAGADVRACRSIAFSTASRGRSSDGCRIRSAGKQTMFMAFGIEGIGLLALGHLGHDPVLFVLLTRPRILRLGRDLQPVSSDVRRYVRLEIRDDKCRSSIHGQRNGVAACAVFEPADEGDRKLACRLLRGSGDEYFRGAAGSAGLEADASAHGAAIVTARQRRHFRASRNRIPARFLFKLFEAARRAP